MPIVAVIDDAKHLSIWSKCVNSLAAVLEHIRFSFRPNDLTLLAVNSSRTTNGEVSFATSFFRELAVSSHLISSEGYTVDPTNPSRSAYSFIVASKHMVMLFKNLNSSNLDYICLRVDCRADTPAARKYKLMVEVLTTKLVVKKFQMNYQPVTGSLNTVVAQYNAEYEKGNIHYFQAETATFKLFLDMVPVATEDFSIEVKQAKIVFGAYTKQVMKDREFLKHPMLITILMATDELMDTNLGSVNSVVNFRLKDMRNFINLCTAITTDTLDTEVYGTQSHFDAFFSVNGHPIVFDYKTTTVSITFIQFTAEDSAKPDLKPEKSSYVLPTPAILKVADDIHSNWASTSNSFSKRDVVQLTKLDVTASKVVTPIAHQQEEPDDLDTFHYSQNITYGKRASTPVESDSVKRAGDDTEYSTSSEDNVPQELGPTQHDGYKPKSLFD